ncbi:hypothetical protein FLK61_31295 [Paenalkalicoccus suaedae]|uniref:Uncharacterized protein n=1 Tax=Paenalkalicoccus suaedae TaxID=2592382 RepID=A0A859FE74_9BACI|nr:hypothetical protein [Paenalkalicoccus suaedae]QKS71201.1 hypothetical protein FLK61_31295 [Paenalkalicoccus suaedae]
MYSKLYENSEATIMNPELKETMVRFIESVSREDLNSSWHHFALLVEDKSSVIDEDNMIIKTRGFQLYYKDKLSYEGVICWSYPEETESHKIEATLSVRLDKVQTSTGLAETTKFQYDVNLVPTIRNNDEVVRLEELPLPNYLTAYDQQRIQLLLSKWGLDTPISLSMEYYEQEDIDFLAQKLVSMTILLQAASKKYHEVKM